MAATAEQPATTPAADPCAFSDAKGRRWRLRITVAHLKPLKELGFNPQQLAEGLERVGAIVFTDPEKLVTWVHLLAAVPPEMTPEDFAEGFDGPTVEDAGYALVAAVLDFFPNCPTARILKGRVGLLREAITNSLTLSIPPIGDAWSLLDSPAPEPQSVG